MIILRELYERERGKLRCELFENFCALYTDHEEVRFADLDVLDAKPSAPLRGHFLVRQSLIVVFGIHRRSYDDLIYQTVFFRFGRA